MVKPGTTFHTSPTTSRTLVVVVGVLVSALMLMSCGGDNPNPAQPTPSVNSDATPPLNLYLAVRTDVETFWQNHYRSQYSPLTRFHLFYGRTSGSCGSPSDAFYCFEDRTVYLELAFLDGQLRQFGDFAAAVIIAHEIGHHIQNVLDVTKPYTISLELEADCLAGVWARNAGARGLLDQGDLEEGVRTLFSLGDPSGYPWFAPEAHGTPLQRVDAFARGYRFGTASCSFYR
jgi:predicted metalloprotease